MSAASDLTNPEGIISLYSTAPSSALTCSSASTDEQIASARSILYRRHATCFAPVGNDLTVMVSTAVRRPHRTRGLQGCSEGAKSVFVRLPSPTRPRNRKDRKIELVQLAFPPATLPCSRSQTAVPRMSHSADSHHTRQRVTTAPMDCTMVATQYPPEVVRWESRAGGGEDGRSMPLGGGMVLSTSTPRRVASTGDRICRSATAAAGFPLYVRVVTIHGRSVYPGPLPVIAAPHQRSSYFVGMLPP